MKQQNLQYYLSMHHDSLPSINHLTNLSPLNQPPHFQLQPPIRTKSTPKAYNYFKALKDLKDVNKQIQTVNNKIYTLTERQQEIKRETKLNTDRLVEKRKLIKSENFKLKEILLTKKMIKQSQIEERRRKNIMRVQEHERTIQNVRKIMSEQKFRVHDTIKQTSQQNQRKIQKYKEEHLQNKRMMHSRLMLQQKQQKQKIKMMNQSRISTIKSFFDSQAEKVKSKIQLKLKELEEMQIMERIMQKNQEETMMRHRNKIHKKMHTKLKTVSRSTNSISNISHDVVVYNSFLQSKD